MSCFKIKSYAKINLSLNITGKLPNKYHRIESLLTFVDLHDLIYLRIIKSNEHKVFFSGIFSKKIGKKNTISKLLKILDYKNLLKGKKFEIRIKKNIPIMSGMGGGSMNAASLLNFFIKKKMIKLTKNRLIKLTYLIGTDVILGINPKNSILSSNGNVTKFQKKLGLYVLIIKPNFGCSTKLIYSKVKYFSKSIYNNPKQSSFSVANIINSKNGLEKVAFKMFPKLKKIHIFLLTLRQIIFARMTGSGSSVVAYFHSKKDAVNARKEFKRKFNNYWCITSKTI
jgi:4-diphosphocytidyl-2-C-methyl-D-erythritol kinase